MIDFREVRTILTAQDRTKGEFSSVRSGLSSVTKFAGLAGAALGTLGLARIASEMIEVNDKFQRLEDMLRTVTGSGRDAEAALAWLSDFATQTPYQLEDVIVAFVKMKALGLDATKDALQSYGNTAAAMGKDLNQMIEAVADASVGEFERLKEFGIKARNEGDQIQFTFQNVTTTVKNSSEDITEYLQGIGNNQFASGMSGQVDNIGTAISNLRGEWELFIKAIGEEGPNSMAYQFFAKVGGLIRTTREWLDVTPQERLAEIVQTIGDLNVELERQHTPATITRLEQRITALKAEYQMLVQANRGDFLHVTEPVVVEGTKPKEEPFTGWGEAGIWEKEAMAEISMRKLQEHNRQKYAAEIEAGEQMQDLWLTQAQGRVEANQRGLDLIIQNEQAAHQMRISAAQNTSSALMNLTNALYTFGGQKSRKMFEMNKVAGIANATISTYAAASAAMKDTPGPFWVRLAAAAAITAGGLAQVANIQNTSFNGGGPASSGGYGGGTPSSPIVTQPTGQPQGPTETKIVIQVDGDVVDLDTWMETKGAPAIREAVGRGVDFSLETRRT